MSDLIWGVDLGGTNLRIAQVDASTGIIHGEPSLYQVHGNIDSDRELGDIILGHIPTGANVGICVAGPVDEASLTVLQAANTGITGALQFAQRLQEEGRNVSLTNDMAAAAMAVATFEMPDADSLLVATYSTGYNGAVARRLAGKLYVFPGEMGHVPYDRSSIDLECGCGAPNHIEMYVSGTGAAAMAQEYFREKKGREIGHPRHPILIAAQRDLDDSEAEYDTIVNAITAKHVYAAASHSGRPSPQTEILKLQQEAIAWSFGAMVSHNPDVQVMVLMGSQTNDWDTLFVPAIAMYETGSFQLPSLAKPLVQRTTLEHIGVQGAAAYFLSKQ